MKTKLQAIRQADKLIQKLQKRIDDNPNKFCENYGQKEVREFEDKLDFLHYVDKCDVMEKFHCVMDMRPNKHLKR